MSTIIVKILDYLGKQPNLFLMLLGLILVLFFGAINYLAGPDFSLSIAYLIPIFMVTWFAGRRAGILLSFACAITSFIAHLITETPYLHLAALYWNSIARLGLFLINTYILSALKNELENEKVLARTDYLTKVFNRRAFYELAEKEINRSHRYNHPFSAAYLDLDNFKTVNDEFGHAKGDSLLYVVAETIKNNIRAIDVIARLGGDEFIILMPETGYESSNSGIERLQKRLLNVMRDNKWPVTFSIGIVTYINPPDSVDEMIREADDLMYHAKKSGKNRIVHKVLDRSARVAL